MVAPPKFVLDTVKETAATARKKWPEIIQEVGLPENMHERLYGYWGCTFRAAADKAIVKRSDCHLVLKKTESS